MTKNRVDLLELAETMERLSKNPNDYHSQAATALRELHCLKTEVLHLSEVWHQQCAGWPTTGSEMLSIGIAVDNLDVIARKL